MNFYPHHIGDYKAATAHLTNEEDLAYRRLLEMYYDTEKPIPLETQWVSRRLRLDTQVIQNVLNDFFIATEEGWRHTRCDAELAHYRAVAEKNRANGAKGGRPKAAPNKDVNPLGSQVVTAGNPVETHSEGNQEPRTINQEPSLTSSHSPAGEAPEEPAKPPAPPLPKPKRKKGDLIHVPDLVEMGIDKAHATDWMRVRAAKGAPLTETALQLVSNEAERAGITLDKAIQISAENSWQGFKAAWYFKALGEAEQVVRKTGGRGVTPGRHDAAARAIFDEGVPLPTSLEGIIDV
jgi:uncharacterized protein YdaU (DUF1376 family)